MEVKLKSTGKKGKIFLIVVSIIMFLFLTIISVIAINQKSKIVDIADLKVKKNDDEIKAANIVETQISGGIKWSIDGDGRLLILALDGNQTPESGYSRGQIVDLPNPGNSPWYGYREQIKHITIGTNDNNVTVKNGNSLHAMFRNCSNVETINLANFNTEGAKDMSYMFYNCNKLEDLKLGDNFNTNSVESMHSMFAGCSKLTRINISTFNTAKVTDMRAMFYKCNSITKLEFPATFDTRKVRDMGYMFHTCKSLNKLDLSSFNTNSLVIMDAMFYGLSVQEELNVGGTFSTLKVGEHNENPYQAMESIFQSSSINKIVLGENFKFYNNSNKVKSTNFGRGTWLKKEDGKKYDAVEICKNLSSNDISTRLQYSGTYTKVSNISKEMSRKINEINRKIVSENNEMIKIEPFDEYTIETDTNSIFRKLNDTHVFAKLNTNNSNLIEVNQRWI